MKLNIFLGDPLLTHSLPDLWTCTSLPDNKSRIWFTHWGKGSLRIREQPKSEKNDTESTGKANKQIILIEIEKKNCKQQFAIVKQPLHQLACLSPGGSPCHLEVQPADTPHLPATQYPMRKKGIVFYYMWWLISGQALPSNSPMLAYNSALERKSVCWKGT